MSGPSGLMNLPGRCVGQVLYQTKKQSALYGCHAIDLRPRRQLTIRRSATLQKHQIRAEEGQRNSYNLTSVKKQAAEHRKRVLSKLSISGMLFMKGNDSVQRNSDVMQPFRQDSNFAYLTGVQDPGFAVAIDSETGFTVLLAPYLDPQLVVWMGAQPSLDDLAEQYGANSCAFLTDLSSIINDAPFKDAPIRLLHAKDRQIVQQFAPQVAQDRCEELVGLQQAVTACRAIKTDADIACLQHASDVSAGGHVAMWRSCQPGMREYELEAEFLRATMRAGLRHTAYPSIVAAGNNAATLHYEQNNAVIGQDDLILVDAGAEYRCFAADISRTFPASGKFTASQKDLYNGVLKVQEDAISRYQNGRGWKEEVAMPSRQRYCEVLLDLGLARGSVDALIDNEIDKIFMPHSLGHFLGLDVHDASPCGPVPDQLKPGHVVTCEPGLYFVEHMLQPAYNDAKKKEFLNRDGIDSFRPFGGIRIEDNVVVESDGNFNLTEAVGMVKSISEIEINYALRQTRA